MTAVARAYAQAAFEVATERAALLFWSRSLKTLSLVIQDAQMRQVLKDPHYQATHLLEIVTGFLHDFSGGEKQADFAGFENLLRLLVEKKRLPILPAISLFFEKLSEKAAGVLYVKVSSPAQMNETQRAALREKLSQQFNCQLTMDFQVNPALIGGLVIRSDCWVLDGSILGQVKRLALALH